jgi:hypothetical protein
MRRRKGIRKREERQDAPKWELLVALDANKQSAPLQYVFTLLALNQ